MSPAAAPSDGEEVGGWEPVTVSCRSDHTYAQEPRRIRWSDGLEEDVLQVLERSIVPLGRRFVVSAGGRRVELMYRGAQDLWLARERAIGAVS